MSEMVYDKSNLETVDLPRRGAGGSARPADQVQVRDLGPHIAGKVAALLDRGLPAHEELAWHAGALKGAGLLDSATSKRFDEFARGMATASDQKMYFNREVKPLLYSLKPAKRRA